MKTKSMTRAVARVAVAGLCWVVLTGCGTDKADGRTSEGAAAPPSVPPSVSSSAGSDCTTDDTSDDGWDESQVPTDEDTGVPEETTDEETGEPQEPTDEDTGVPEETTEEDAGEQPDRTTDDTADDPCSSATWFVMTRDFRDYLAAHGTKADDGLAFDVVKVRKVGAVSQAVVTVSYTADDTPSGRRVATAFAAWRHAVYGDRGTVRIESGGGLLITTEDW
ncbi:hypothetical protein ACQEVG_02170 [Streptomyces sp. CA-135486]|uniref:hypothetical protein n=1 Tax=Streptomyces sp. CA-135486 TaxID=3240049 RepID=UPI003D92FAAF